MKDYLHCIFRSVDAVSELFDPIGQQYCELWAPITATCAHDRNTGLFGGRFSADRYYNDDDEIITHTFYNYRLNRN